MRDWESAKPISILLIEDNPGDIRLTKEALKEAKVQNDLFVVEDGIKALAYLRRESPYEQAEQPDLILLDLNLPGKDGREVLQDIELSPQLKPIPVIILTTSRADEDILQAYELHARGYITKPVDFDQLLEVIHSIEEFGLAFVRTPRV